MTNPDTTGVDISISSPLSGRVLQCCIDALFEVDATASQLIYSYWFILLVQVLSGLFQVKILTSVNGGKPCRHVPQLFQCGKRAKFSYMIVTLLGENLRTLRLNSPGERMTPETWARLGQSFILFSLWCPFHAFNSSCFAQSTLKKFMSVAKSAFSLGCPLRARKEETVLSLFMVLYNYGLLLIFRASSSFWEEWVPQDRDTYYQTWLIFGRDKDLL